MICFSGTCNTWLSLALFCGLVVLSSRIHGYHPKNKDTCGQTNVCCKTEFQWLINYWDTLHFLSLTLLSNINLWLFQIDGVFRWWTYLFLVQRLLFIFLFFLVFGLPFSSINGRARNIMQLMWLIIKIIKKLISNEIINNKIIFR